ncbi:MAG: ATP-dependent DNA helicase, partial [Patescibacteria group bacterium]
VDEHQDTNEGQNRIIDVIASSKHLGSDPNLFTVGDDKQAIYRFQGANVESFMNFGDKFENPVTINLENNYRSAQGILDHAHTLISAGESKKEHTELTAFKKDEADVAVRHFKTYRDELVNLASDIKKRIESGIAPEDIAVFYRENNNLDFIKEVFEKEDLPFVVASKQNILDDAQIQKLLLLMSVVNDPMNNELMAKAILIDLVEIKSSDALLVLDKYKVLSRKMSLFELLKDKKQLKESRVKDIKSIEKFVSFLEKQIEKSHNTDFLEFFEQFVNESAFLEFILKRKDHIFLLKKLEKIYEEVKNAILEKKNYTLGDFVANIDTFYQYNLSMNVTRSVEARGVNLMSAHGSKGLEFEHVYITNAVNGLWGGKRSINKFKLPIDVAVGDMEDERRLFYVAITRAKQSLVISYADFDVNGKEKLSSLFISDINARLIDIEQDSVASTKVFFAPRIKDVSSLVSLEYIRDKFLETPISASSLNNYFESPLLYFFRNIVRLPSVPNKILLNGTVMHSALENYFKLSSEANKVLPKKVLLESLGDALETMQVPADYFGEIEKKGTEMLSGYWDFYKDDFNIDVAVEKKIKAVPFKLDGGEEILLTGAIDKMELLGEGTVSVVDYKTGKAWSQLAKDKKDSLGRQVMFYKLLLNLYNGGEFKMTEGTLDFIEPNSKTGQYEREVISVDDESAEKLKKDINVFAKDILSGEFLEREINKKFGNKSLDEYIRLLKILKND